MKPFVDRATDESSIDVKPSLSSLFADFQALVDLLKTQRPRCYWMLLSLALFHGSFLRKPLAWLLKLHEKGIIEGVDCKGAKPKDLKSGTIHVHTREVVDAFFDLNKGWETDYEDLVQTLLGAGLMHQAETPPGCLSYVHLHSLLPYMIRYEIMSNSSADHRNLMAELQTMVWEYHESFVAFLTIDGFARPGAQHSFSMQIQNLLNTFRICTERAQFDFREMRVLNFLPLIGWPNIPQKHRPLALKTLTFIAEGFEHLNHLEHFSRNSPDVNVQRAVMTQALMAFYSRGLLLSAMKSSKMIIWNSKRAMDLLISFEKKHRLSVNGVAAVYAIQCQAVLYRVMPLAAKCQRLKELIAKPLQSGASPLHEVHVLRSVQVHGYCELRLFPGHRRMH